MKKYLLLYKIILLCLPGIGQLTISDGITWGGTGNFTITIHNIDLVNNGNFGPGTGSVKLTGNQNSAISGNIPLRLNMLEIAKTNGAKISLNSNIKVASSINFISGQIDLNGNNILLTPAAYIAGESENNRIIGPNGGFVEITQNMNAPASVNPGNLGATISSSADLGDVTIRRGHTPQSGIGLTTSINRYYFISPQNNSDLNATLRLRYFDAELNGQNENALVIYQTFSGAGTWNNLYQTTRNSNANYVEKTNIGSFALQTLATDNVQQADGATGLVLTGQRKKATEVTLKWTSQTETNMSGYQVQRRLKNETDFTDRNFVNSMATAGNSLTQLSYQHIDANSYTDTSFYRLKILTTNNTFTYSNTIAVPGKAKGGPNGNNREAEADVTSVSDNSKGKLAAQKITVGPNPNNGDFWFRVNGIKEETIATLFFLDGKQIKQFRVVNLRQQHVTGLSSGIYILSIPGFDTQKIIVNSGGHTAPQSTPSNINIKF